MEEKDKEIQPENPEKKEEKKEEVPEKKEETPEKKTVEEPPLPEGEKLEFTAEIQKLLNILVHSLYTHKEIFIRELISNASDALDKVRFMTLIGKTVRDDKLPLEIDISVDKEKNILTIADTGVGMTREELIENIGTIAHSGSFSFLKHISEQKDSKASLNLIGQFGVGFYSVFMVAKRVDIITLSSNPDASAFFWSSDGSGKYTIAPVAKETRGTEIRLYLKDDAKDFLESARIERVVRRYSDFVSYPIKYKGEKINKLAAIWHRTPSEIKEEEYDEFFTYLTHHQTLPSEMKDEDFGEYLNRHQNKPASHIHLSIDAPIQFKSILYIPGEVPMDMMFDIPEKWRGMHLYAKRIFIQSDCEELMPRYLRFVRGVVDSDDLPLNISRETLQENQMIVKIRRTLVRKILEHLQDMSEKKADEYRKLWKNFGKFIKQGYREDYENRERVAQLLRFNSSKCQDEDEVVSLSQYVSRMAESQKEIYYLSGENRSTIEKSPHMEIFKNKGIEVLYFTEPVDDFLVTDLHEFQQKKLVSADQEGIALDSIKTEEKKEDEKKPEEKKESEGVSDKQVENLVQFLKVTLKDRVLDVKISQRLTGSSSCLVGKKDGPSLGMEKLMKLWNQKYEMSHRVLEINKNHPMIQRMAKIYSVNPGESVLVNLSYQLVDNALLLEGTPLDIREMVPRIQDLMEQVTKLMSGGAEQPNATEKK